jgi:hypothetical protein
MRVVLAVSTAVVLVAAAGAAHAADFSGVYSGASSIATGTKDFCTGNAPTRATVTGDTIVIDGQAYEGVEARGTGSVHGDGTFSAVKVGKDGGQVSYSGKISGRNLIATWKGPICTGTLSLSR